MKRFVIFLALSAATRCIAQAPPNDYFTNRIALIGPVAIFGGDTTGANWPDDEEVGPCPVHYCSQSVWWSWTAQDSTPVIIERLGETTFEHAGLAVYATTNMYEMNFANVGSIDLAKRGQYVVFQPQAGKEYEIQIGGNTAKPVVYRLTITNAPIFRLQPRTQTVSPGQSALFTSSAVGVKPLYYQWQQDGLDILNATNQMLAFDNCALSNAAEYRVVVTSATGGANTSAVARLIVSTNDFHTTLAVVGTGAGTKFQFSVTGEEGRSYRSEFSTDLTNWGGGVIINTNPTTVFETPKNLPAQFMRLVSYHAGNEVCNNNMKELRFAIWQYAEDVHESDLADPSWEELAPYLIDGKVPSCPLRPGYYGYYVITTPLENPVCRIAPAEHFLEEP